MIWSKDSKKRDFVKKRGNEAGNNVREPVSQIAVIYKFLAVFR